MAALAVTGQACIPGRAAAQSSGAAVEPGQAAPHSPVTIQAPNTTRAPAATIPSNTAPESVTAPPAEDRGPWLGWKHMSGNWGGLRTRLEDIGIDVTAHYGSESAANPIGGLSHGAAYTQEVNVGLEFDLEKLAGWKNAKLTFSFNRRDGQSLSLNNIGNLGAVQELYGAGLDSRVEQLTLEQSFLNKTLDFMVGWSPPGNDFASDILACDFQTVVVCGHTPAMSGNSNWRNYPTALMGARARYRFHDQFYVQTAIYRGNDLSFNHGTGLDLAYHGNGVLVPVELGWQPGGHDAKSIGNYKIGGYYDSSHANDVLTDIHGQSAGLTGAPFLRRDGRWGVYAVFNQTLFREAHSKTRGLSITASIGHGDPRIAKYSYTGDVGLVYQGTFRGRDDDFVGLAIGHLRINGRTTRYERDSLDRVPDGPLPQTDETVIDAVYGLQLTPWLFARPDVQYIVRPDGTGHIPNTLVFGLGIRATI